jgi:hypothetical protein
MANMHQNPLKIRLPARHQAVKEATCLRSESKHFALGPIQYPTGDGFGSLADVTASNGEVRFVPLGVSSGLAMGH